MKLNEAKEILKKNGFVLSEKKADPQYDRRGLSRYGFNNPNKGRDYVKMLNFLYHAENGMTKKMVHNWLGLNTAPGNHSGTWTEMSDAGLAKYDEHERVWKITAKGRKYLEDNDLVIDLDELTKSDEESLKSKVVDVVNDFKRGCTREQIAMALDVAVAELTGPIRACLDAGEIVYNDDMGGFITPEYQAYLDGDDEPAKEESKFVDPDDDMYDDTPIVRQRVESFKAFAEKQGYSFVNESSQGYKLVKFITKNLKMPALRKVSAVMQDFTNSVSYDFDDNIVAAVDDPVVDTVVRIISELSPTYAKRIVVEEDNPAEIADDNED